MFRTKLAHVVMAAALVLINTGGAIAPAHSAPSSADGERRGVPVTGSMAVQQRVSEIVARDEESSQTGPAAVRRGLGPRGRGARAGESDPAGPAPSSPRISSEGPRAAQTVATSFTGATLADTNAFPPDSMGAVGPTQFLVMLNGRIRTFNKATGTADGVLNTTTNAFFESERNGARTADPRVRYDRLSQRWFLAMINVVLPNRILIAVSDAASNGVISGATVFSFFSVPVDTTSSRSDPCLGDYPTLGVDVNALYIGTNNFCGASLLRLSFDSTEGYVIRKSSVLGRGPIVVTVFQRLATSTADGPFTPQGVDNYDSAATEGYFIGVSALFFDKLVTRRVSDPGGTPTISANIDIPVDPTAFPITVPHLGNTGGAAGNLDALDDRLMAAHIRNGRLWTTHNIGVNSSGVGDRTSPTRDAVRWYELQNLAGTPSVAQSGTVFDPAASNPKFYWMPSIMVSGQGHAAMGGSSAGALNYANAFTAGRLAGDPPGTMGTPVEYTTSSTAYNPPGDPGGLSGRRWGDYSYTSLDPDDDMTMWTIQEFCNATDSYGVQVAKLLAPPPAAPVSASPSAVSPGLASVRVTITGASSAGSGFFDPGAGFARRIGAAVSGGVTVTSVTYISPTSVTLDLNTTAAGVGAKNVTITNPDGQSATGAGILAVGSPPVAAADSYSTVANAARIVPAPGLLANDTDPDGDALTAVKVTDPAHGTATVNPDGSFTYTPAADFTGVDSFTYKANDGALDSNVAAVSITVTGQSFAFSAGDYSVDEGAGAATITVTRAGGSAGTQTVAYGTSDGSAVSGRDYQPTSGTLTFNPGETSAAFQVPIVDDAAHGVNRTFTVTLGSASPGGLVGSPSSATVTIVQNDPPGYRMVATDGGIFAFGGEGFFGSTGAMRLNAPVVGMAETPSQQGYWLVASDGGIFSFGDAQFFGSTGAIRLNQPIVAMAATPTGGGYWMVARDGGVFAFGDAQFFGSAGDAHLTSPVVAMATTPSGHGYWMATADGRVLAFGDARDLGSLAGVRLNLPVVGMARTVSGAGYWLVASDGGIFSFGDAQFFGSTGDIRLNQPIVGLQPTDSGAGYWMVASDGGVFAFGDAPFLGSTGAIRLNRPVVGMA